MALFRLARYSVRPFAALLTFVFAISSLAEVIVLDNGAIRIEIDPVVFSVRFIGFPGGANFIEPSYLTEPARAGAGWLDPGGLTTDLVPLEVQDAALRRGPAEVLSQESTRVVLLGAESEALGLRLKKEVRIDASAAHAYFIVTALSSRAEGVSLGIRNTVRVPLRSTVRVPRKDTTFAPLPDMPKAPWALVKSVDYWLVPIPPTARVDKMVLGGMSPALDVQNDAGVWSRRLTLPPTDVVRVLNGTNALVVLDDASRSYGASLQGEQGTLGGATPLQLTEEWTLTRRGR